MENNLMHIFESHRSFTKIPKPRWGLLFIPLKHVEQWMERRGLYHLLVFCKHRSVGSCLTSQNLKLILRYPCCLLVQISTARLRVSLLDPQVHSCDPWLWGTLAKNGRNGHRDSEVTPSQTVLIVTWGPQVEKRAQAGPSAMLENCQEGRAATGFQVKIWGQDVGLFFLADFHSHNRGIPTKDHAETYNHDSKPHCLSRSFWSLTSRWLVTRDYTLGFPEIISWVVYKYSRSVGFHVWVRLRFETRPSTLSFGLDPTTL